MIGTHFTLPRWAIACVLALLVATLPALAEDIVELEMPIDPNRAAVMAVFERGEPRMRAASALKVRLMLTDGDYFTGATWTATVTGAEGACQCLFQMMRFDELLNKGYELIANQSYSENATFTWTALASGSYQLRVWVKDDAGNSGYTRLSFEADDPEYPSIDDRVAAIVEQCDAAGCASDFDRALWLHDWLTMNAKYDYDYYHYGSDGVLAAGTGVCDSYAKAYLKLLDAAGVACRYASGTAKGGSHAWNAMCLDGEWYWVDVTWDDPGRSDTTVSGSERHIYFGVPDAPMAVDHTCTDGGDAGIACTSYIHNYFIHTGRVSMWTALFENVIAGDLERGLYLSRPGLPDSYPSEKAGFRSRGNEAIVYSVTAYALNQRDDWSTSGEAVALEVTYDIDGSVLTARVIFDGGLLFLPAGLNEIGEDAFRGDTGIVSVDLPAGVTAIGPGAFAECARLWRVYIPDTVAELDASAFDGCPRVCLTGPSGGVAQRYAGLYGLNYVEE